MTARSAFTGNPKELVVHINSRRAGTWIPERTNDSNKFNPGLWLCVIIAEHLVHTPSHIYIRTGDHESGEKTNVAAMRVDDAYFAVAHPQGIYPLMYYTHNLHFIAAENAFMGNYSASLQAALRAAAPAMAKMALNSTGPHNSEVIPQMMSEVVEARASPRRSIRPTPPSSICKERYRSRNTLEYDKPPDWLAPTRGSLGAALLNAGKTTDAEAAFREDLKRNPRSPRSLFVSPRHSKPRAKPPRLLPCASSSSAPGAKPIPSSSLRLLDSSGERHAIDFSHHPHATCPINRPLDDDRPGHQHHHRQWRIWFAG